MLNSKGWVWAARPRMVSTSARGSRGRRRVIAPTTRLLCMRCPAMTSSVLSMRGSFAGRKPISGKSRQVVFCDRRNRGRRIASSSRRRRYVREPSPRVSLACLRRPCGGFRRISPTRSAMRASRFSAALNTGRGAYRCGMLERPRYSHGPASDCQGVARGELADAAAIADKAPQGPCRVSLSRPRTSVPQ